MKKSLVILLALVLQAALIGQALAQKPKVVVSDKAGWHKIGEVNAPFKDRVQSISVLGADNFKAIKFKATDAPIKIEKATVDFESGHTEDLPINAELNVGEETKVFNLAKLEDIRTVTITYSSMANYRNEKAHVEFYGLK